MVELIRRLVRGALAQGDPVLSLLIVGPPGTGKTSLARAIASATKTAFHAVPAGRDLRHPLDLTALMLQAEHADVVLIDEAHGLSGEVQDILNLVLDDNKVLSPSAKEEGKVELISVADCCIVLATNRPGKIRPALRSRLQTVELDAYTVAELAEVAKRVAAQDGIVLTPQAARRLAEVAQGIPRNVERRLDAAKAFHPNASELSQPLIEQCLRSEGIDENSLTTMQRRYLEVLDAAQQRPLSLHALAVQLGVDECYVLDEVEPFLRLGNYVEISGRGRVLAAERRG